METCAKYALTLRQRQCLEFIRDYQREHGITPSYDEMAKALDLKSKSGVHRIIHALRERRFIRVFPNRARAIEIIAAFPPRQTDLVAVWEASSDEERADFLFLVGSDLKRLIALGVRQ